MLAGFGVGLLSAGAISGVVTALSQESSCDHFVCMENKTAAGLVGMGLMPLTAVFVGAVGNALDGDGRTSVALLGTTIGAGVGLLVLYGIGDTGLSDDADTAVKLSTFSVITAAGTVLAYELSTGVSARRESAAIRVSFGVLPLRDGSRAALGVTF